MHLCFGHSQLRGIQRIQGLIFIGDLGYQEEKARCFLVGVMNYDGQEVTQGGRMTKEEDVEEWEDP